MILNLSRRAQRGAQRCVLRYMVFNSIGASLTMTSLIPLLALHYGAGDLVMGLVYAALYVTGLAALLAPLFLNGAETSSIWRRAWLFRGLVGFAYLGLPLLPSPEWKVVGLLAIYYTFMMFRAVGISAWYVAQKAICPARTMQSFAARNTIRHLVAALPATAFAFVVLEYGLLSSEEGGFMLVLAVGGGANFIAYRMLRRLPETGYLTEGSLAGVVRAFRVAFRERPIREVVLLTFIQTILAVSLMYQINYMRKVAEFSSATVFLVMTLSMVATLVAAYLLKITGDYIPFRALLFSSHFALLAVGLGWIWIEAIPHAGSVAVLGSLYALSAAGLNVSGTVVNRLQTVRLPTANAYGVSLVYQVVTVLGALAGTGAVAATAPLVAGHETSFLHPYTHAFGVWACMSAAICLMSIVVRSGRQLQFREDLAFLTPSNLFTILRVYRAEHRASPANRQILMEGAIMTPSRMSRKMILQWTGSADTTERIRALRLLNLQPVPEAFEAVRREAASRDSPLRLEAITTLGFLGNPDARDDLRPLLSDRDPSVQAVALKSLYRLGEAVPEQTLLEIYQGVENSAMRLHVLAGLSSTGQRGPLMRILRSELARQPDAFWIRSLLLHVTQAYGRRESMTDIFNAELEQRGAGLAYVLAETEPALLAGVDSDRLRDIFTRGAYSDLQALLPDGDSREFLALAFDRDSALGLLFLWTVLHGEEAAPCPR